MVMASAAAILDAATAEPWAAFAEAGFAGLLRAEAAGGFGGDALDLLAVARLLGARAVAAPVGEAIVAAALDPALEGMGTIAPEARGGLARGRFTGRLTGVPWGRAAAAVIARVEAVTVALDPADARVTHGLSPAGEPRDTLIFNDAPARALPGSGDPLAWGALLRVGQIAGAVARALAMSVEHANTRQQFGAPLARLQAVQQALAVMAVDGAALDAAAEAAAGALSRGEAGLEIAAAKLRAGMGAGVGAAIAHQVHGAIGFTREYPLHLLTRRLAGWRSEFGGEAFWATRLGQSAAALGPEGLWDEITRRSDAG